MSVRNIIAFGTLVGAVAMAVALLVTGGPASAGGTPDSAKYVGHTQCRACHFRQYRSWSKTRHAEVWDQLKGDERKEPGCVKCHTTGYGEPGGFVSAEETPGLKDVGCEACHGPGSAHVEAAKKAPASGEWDVKIDKVPRNACVQCHNPHLDQPEAAREALKKK